jgi:hypothetical protein
MSTRSESLRIKALGRTLSFAIALSVTLLPLRARAAEIPPGKFYGYLGLGELFRPETLRLGYESWEGGFVTGGSLGFGKVLRMQDGPTFGSFGISVQTFPTASPGFYGSVGQEYRVFEWARFRGEILLAAHLNNRQTLQFVIGTLISF